MDATTLTLTLAATALFEVLTCVGRFGLKLRSREIAPRYKKYTFGVRIHHGYVGVMGVPPAFLPGVDPAAQTLLIAVAAGLILSDLLHHFVVLPLLTGKCD